MNVERLKIAELARKLYKGEVSYSDFVEALPEPNQDEDVDWLGHLIEHEPKQGGFLGASKEEHQKHMDQIFQAIEKLENEST